MASNYQTIRHNQSEIYIEAYLLSEDGMDTDIWPPYKGIEFLSSGTLNYRSYYDKEFSIPVNTGRVYPVFIRKVLSSTTISASDIIVYR